MYLLDTNVVSELRKAKSGKADARVIAWAAGLPASELFLSAISVLELETGSSCSSSDGITHRPRCCAYGSINTYCLLLTAESFLSIPQSRATARSCMFLTRVQSATP
jgi:hypothetical protein